MQGHGSNGYYHNSFGAGNFLFTYLLISSMTPRGYYYTTPPGSYSTMRRDRNNYRASSSYRSQVSKTAATSTRTGPASPAQSTAPPVRATSTPRSARALSRPAAAPVSGARGGRVEAAPPLASPPRPGPAASSGAAEARASPAGDASAALRLRGRPARVR